VDKLLNVLSFLLGYLISRLADLVQLYSFFKNETRTDGKTSLVVSLSSGLLVSLLIISIQHLYYHRRARYVDVIQSLYDLAADIQKMSEANNATKVEIEQKCRQVVNQLNRIMKTVTGKQCFACIKTVTIKKKKTEYRLVATTLCRDNDSQERVKRQDNVIHWVGKNTTFEQLQENPEKNRIYFKNYLPLTKPYENTSFDLYGGEPSKNRLIRLLTWNLPYKSTIVVSILAEDHSRDEKVIGFLCVDSRPLGVFHQNDVVIMQKIADALTPILLRHEQISTSPPIATSQNTT
jgi:hypothetical protein